MEEVGRRDYVWGESNREWQETGLPVMKYKQWRFIAPISLQAATERTRKAGESIRIYQDTANIAHQQTQV